MAGEFQNQGGVSSVTISRSATGKPSWDVKIYEADIEKAVNMAAFINYKLESYYGVQDGGGSPAPCRIKLPDDLKSDYPAIREITDAAAVTDFPAPAHDSTIDDPAPAAGTSGGDHPDNWGKPQTSAPAPAATAPKKEGELF